MAMILQYLSGKLGIATGNSLPELLKTSLGRRAFVVPYWLAAEAAAAATDLAEYLGTVVALNLLFGVQLLYAAIFGAFDVFERYVRTYAPLRAGADSLYIPEARYEEPVLVFTPEAWWALLPLGLYAFGWALMVPVVTLLVLDLMPERRGMASSFQAFVGSMANGFVAGAIAPLVMHSTQLLAAASLGLMSIGIFAWIWVKPRVT